MSKFTRSFITGSWAYGDPTRCYEYCFECNRPIIENCSDIDLVVLVNQEDLKTLERESEKPDPSSASRTSTSLRFGKLNLICETSDAKFQQWRIGTKTLQKLSSVRESTIAREEAVAILEQLRKKDEWDGFVHTFEFLKLTAQGLLDGTIKRK